MFCANCGSAIEGEHRFCSRCGAPVAGEGVRPPAAAPYAYAPPPQSVGPEAAAEQSRRRDVSVAFSSNHVLAQWLCVVLWLTLALAVAAVALDLVEVYLVSQVIDGDFGVFDELEANDDGQAVVGALQFIVFVACAVLFLVWIYRAHRNLPALDASGLKYSPRWAVGGFFIPVMNLWRPYQVTAEIWKASDPDYLEPEGRAWQNAPVSPLVNLWWVVWIVSGVIGWVILRLVLEEPTDLEMFRARSLVLAATDAIGILVAALAALVVWRIDGRQEEKNRRLQRARLSASRPLSASGGTT